MTQKFSKIDNAGTIVLQVKSKGSFECKLLLFKDGMYKEVEEVFGMNDGEVVFSSLAKDIIYKVKVIFRDEEALCRIRQLGGIKF